MAAGLAAVILLALLPVRTYVLREAADREIMIGQYLDEYTSLCATKRRIEAADHLNLIGRLARIGIRCDVYYSVVREEIGSVSGTYIPDDVISGELGSDSGFRLYRGDSLTVEIGIGENSMIKVFTRKLLITDIIQEHYSSGIVV